MSTSTLTSPTATSPHASPGDNDMRLTFARIVNSEWIKFRTLRSTLWTLASTLVLIVGIVTLFSAVGALESNDTAGGDGGGSVTVFSIAATLSQLAVVVLGVLVVTGEYSTGMIRSTFAGVPRRLPAMWAKCVVLAGSIIVVSLVAVGISLASMQLIYGADGLAPDLGDGETLRILVGMPLYLGAIALLAFAIGALLRHSAGALATVLGLLLVVENLFSIPWKPLQTVSPFLPGTAGSRLLMPHEQIDSLSEGAVGVVLGPWQGFAVLVAWVVVLLGIAAVLLKRRDA